MSLPSSVFTSLSVTQQQIFLCGFLMHCQKQNCSKHGSPCDHLPVTLCYTQILQFTALGSPTCDQSVSQCTHCEAGNLPCRKPAKHTKLSKLLPTVSGKSPSCAVGQGQQKKPTRSYFIIMSLWDISTTSTALKRPPPDFLGAKR